MFWFYSFWNYEQKPATELQSCFVIFNSKFLAKLGFVWTPGQRTYLFESKKQTKKAKNSKRTKHSNNNKKNVFWWFLFLYYCTRIKIRLYTLILNGLQCLHKSRRKRNPNEITKNFVCTANAHAWMSCILCQYAPARTIWKNTRLIMALNHKWVFL